MITVLDALVVTQFADRSWCRGIEYHHGAFSSLTEDDSGCISRVVPKAFDGDADEAFSAVRRALDATGVGVSDVSVSRGAGGITRAEFDLRAGAFDRFYYIYEPGAPLPEEMPGEAEYTRIDADWSFEWEDWN